MKGAIDKNFLDENGNLLPELKRFNWGAFFLTWIWGIFNNTFITLIVFIIPFIPVVRYLGFIFHIWFGIKGNEWALKNKEWKSIEHFQGVQRKWAAAGGIVLCLSFIVGVIAGLTIPSMVSSLKQEEYKIGYIKSASVLEQAIKMETALNNKLDTSSGEALAKAVSEHMTTIKIQGNKITIADGTTYVFECSKNSNCTVIADVNGDKTPNELTKSAANPKDKIEFKLVKKGDIYEIVKPDWYKKKRSAK